MSGKARDKATQLKSGSPSQVRLDKWLWAARFYKTRTIAKEAIEGGKVQYNGQRCKPGKTVDIGAMLKIRQGWFDKEVEVTAISDRRQTASIAQTLYEETQESFEKREKELLDRKALAAAQPKPFKRPSKKDRRQIHRFRVEQSNNSSDPA